MWSSARWTKKKTNSASLVCDQPLLFSFHHTCLRLSTLPLIFKKKKNTLSRRKPNSSWLTTGKLTRGQDDFRQITLETNSFHFCGPSASLAVTVIYIFKQDSWIICMFKIIYSNTQITQYLVRIFFLISESCNVSYGKLNTQENTFSGHSRRIYFCFCLCALLSSLSKIEYQ